MSDHTLWVVNPNTTASMTEAVLRQVRLQLPPGFSARGITAVQGAAVIDSQATFDAAAAAVPALVAQSLIQSLTQSISQSLTQSITPSINTQATPSTGGILLACFGDPGLHALRQAVAPLPVVGLAQAAVASAVAMHRRFAILTAGPAWVDLLRRRVADFGAADWLTGVHALPVNGGQLAADPQRFVAALRTAAHDAECGGAQALILGGAAFAGLAALVETSLPVIDAIDAATTALLKQLG